MSADLRTVARGWRWGRRPIAPRSAQAHLPAAEPSVFPTSWARGPAARAARDAVQRFGLRPLVGTQLRPRVAGLDVLDRVEPPCVFVANHASHLDTALLLTALPHEWRRRTAVAAAADYFFDVWWRGFGSALAFNTFPIERRRRASGMPGRRAKAVGPADQPSTAAFGDRQRELGAAGSPAEMLADGWNVLVYPEGTRSADGWMGRFRYGAAYLAVATGVPVVPVALRGTFAAMPRGRPWPRPGRPPVHVRIGAPLRSAAGEEPREFGDRIRGGVARLLDEDASTWWEAARRAAEGATPNPAGPPVARWRRVWAASEPPTEPARLRAWR